MLAVVAVMLGLNLIVGGSPPAGAQAMGAGCPGDCHGDAEVNVIDLLQLLADWGLPFPCCDFNGDGAVNVPDLLTLLANWGMQCP